MNQAESYSILVLDLPDDKENVVNVLINTLGEHRIDARLRVRSLPGVLPRTFPLEQATQLVSALKEAGCRAAVTKSLLIPNLLHAPQLHHIRCEPSGLEILDLEGTVAQEIPWSSLLYLSVGSVPTGTLHKRGPAQVSSQVSSTRSPLSSPVRPEHLTNLLWIACDNPEHYILIHEHEMNYEFLGEKMTTSSNANFRLLVRALLSFAPHVATTNDVRLFLENRLQEQYSYESADALREFVAGQIAVVRELRQRRDSTQQSHDQS